MPGPSPTPEANQLRRSIEGVASVDGVLSVVVLDKDGLVIESIFRDEDASADLISGLACVMLEANAKTGESLGSGALQYLMSDFDKGRLFMMRMKSGAAFLIVHAEKKVNVGLAKYAMEKAKSSLESLL